MILTGVLLVFRSVLPGRCSIDSRSFSVTSSFGFRSPIEYPSCTLASRVLTVSEALSLWCSKPLTNGFLSRKLGTGGSA